MDVERSRLGLGFRFRSWRRWRWRRSRCRRGRRGVVATTHEHESGAQGHGKKEKQVKPETLEFARFVIVFTTFPEAEFSAGEVLEWYRLHWQVELVFKRFKSLAQLGHLPKYDEDSARAWLYGKLFVALLVEKIIRHAESVSPWGHDLAAAPAA